jgi:hypothetical protein
MNIKQTFLKLTSHTYPHGTESAVLPLLPKELNTDEFGNLYIEIGTTTTMFASHLDTATKADCPVKHVFDNNIIKTDGTSILGADDKAGVTIMLHMIEKKIPGLYYFFLGEEVGCVGSKKLAEKLKTTNIYPHIKKCISFDRRGTKSVISFQFGTRCCSDNFAKDLSSKINSVSTLKLEPDPTGLYTDSAQFIKIFPECTNISVGYQNEHTFNELQDIVYLEQLADAVIKIDWEKLVVERDPSVTEYDYNDDYYGTQYGQYRNNYKSWNYGNRNYNNSGFYGSGSKTKEKPVTKKQHFYDEKWEHVTTIESELGEITKINLHPERLKAESNLIQDLFDILEIKAETYTWDGLELVVNYRNNGKTVFTRKKLMDFLPEIDYTDFVAK